MLTAAVTALLSAALAGVDGTAVDLQVTGRAEASTRVFVQNGELRQLVATDILPRLSVLLDRKTLRGAVGYEPQLRITRDPAFPGTDANLAHGGFGRAEWDLHPLWRATGAVRGSVRLVDVMSAALGEAARLLELRAPDTMVRFREVGASAGLEGHPTRRVTVGSSAGVSDSGGVGAGGRLALPGLRELRASASVARDWTREDVLRLELTAISASFDAGTSAALTTVGLGWAHEATRSLRLRLVATASDAREDAAPERVIPGGEAELIAAAAFRGRPLRATAAVRTGPAPDRFAAGIQERIGADAAIGWEPVPRWSVGAGAAYGHVREARGYSASRGELRGGWRATRRVGLFATGWSEWHRDPGLVPTATASYWGASVGVELVPVPR